MMLSIYIPKIEGVLNHLNTLSRKILADDKILHFYSLFNKQKFFHVKKFH